MLLIIPHQWAPLKKDKPVVGVKPTRIFYYLPSKSIFQKKIFILVVGVIFSPDLGHDAQTVSTVVGCVQIYIFEVAPLFSMRQLASFNPAIGHILNIFPDTR